MTNCPHCPALVPEEKLADHVRNKHPEKLKPLPVPKPGAQGEDGLPAALPVGFRPGFPVRPQDFMEFKCDLCQRPFATQQGRGRHRAACIKHNDAGLMDAVRSVKSKNVGNSADALRRQASELRSQAAKLIDEAGRFDKAADVLEGPK